MITQYSRVQLTLSEKEKEYAWFQYAAELCKAGCKDQRMSGYSVTGTGMDGKPVTAELTNEELFQLFAEVTMKYGKRILQAEEEQQISVKAEQTTEKSRTQDTACISDSPLERRDFQIQITRHELKTRKADVSIVWGNNLKVEGLYIASQIRGGVRLGVPVYFIPDGGRMDLLTVSPQLGQAILKAYQQMENEGKDQYRISYFANQSGIQIRTRPADEGAVIGYADVKIGQELCVQQIRIRRSSDGRLSCMYPAQAHGSSEKRKWHNLAAELSDCRLHEEILKVFQQEHPRKAGAHIPSPTFHNARKMKRDEPEEEEEWER